MPFYHTLPAPALRGGARLARAFHGPRATRVARDLRDAARLRVAEVVLVSFPKSGRTFVRAMMARLYQSRFGYPESELLEFAGIRRSDPSVPRLAFTHDGDAMRRPDEVIGSKRAYRGCKVGLIARHPADVAISRYHHLKHRATDAARRRLAEQPLEDFIWVEQGGIPSIVAFLNGWTAERHTPRDFGLFRYEDFRNAPEETLAALARFVGLKCPGAEIADAAEFARFENLKKRESDGYFNSVRMGATKPGDENSSKVRAGKVGGYRGQFPPELCERIDAYVAERLDPVFGYGASAA